MVYKHGGSSGISSAPSDSWLIQMELQLGVTEEELLEFPEVSHDQINISHTDNPAGKVVHSTEKKSSHQNSSRSHGSCSADTHSKIKVERPHYKWPVAHRRRLVTSPQNLIVRQPVRPKVCHTTKVYFDCKKQRDR